MYQLFIFIQTFSRYQRDDVDVSIDVTTLKALQYNNSKIDDFDVNKWIVSVTIHEE